MSKLAKLSANGTPQGKIGFKLYYVVVLHDRPRKCMYNVHRTDRTHTNTFKILTNKLFLCNFSLGTFAPVWQILKNSTERLATIHLQMMQKIAELVKELAKYADELQKKYKTVKELTEV